MFHLLLYDHSKHDAVTTAAHSKQIIDILKSSNVLDVSHSNIWENTDGCDEHYICDTALYLLSILLK